MSKPRKQIILGAYLGGVHQHTLWPDPATGSQIDFATVRHVAQTAERGKFDFFFLAEGLILRERIGLIVDRDVIGRPDTLPVLAAIATVTEHLGLIGTLNTAFNEPYELARQLASFDHLSGGRAGRLERGDLARRIYRAAVQRPPQSARPPGDPAGRRLPAGRDFAAANADAIFSPYRQLPEARAFYQDINARAARQGRPAGAVKLLPSASFLLGDSKAEALERYREIRHAQVGGKTAQMLGHVRTRRDFAAAAVCRLNL